MYNQSHQSAKHVREQFPHKIDVAVILGSGLGALCDMMDVAIEIPYSEIPNFPIPTVAGHSGRAVIGRIGDKTVLALSGRFHFYEGYSMQQAAFPVWVVRALGIEKLILTNAAGGVNTAYKPGDLMLISDHIKFFDDSPLRGKNEDAFGERFPDMSGVYSKVLRDAARLVAAEQQIELCEGVYFYMPGPQFETPAEIRAIRTLGGDAVGMSTVPEAIAARHCGIEVLGVSCISNMAAGILDQPLTHAEVIETGEKVKDKFSRLVKGVIEQLTIDN